MNGELRLNITSDPANLADVRRAIEQLCAENGFPDSVGADLGLCLNESMANIIRHAYGGAKDRPIEIRAKADDGQVRVTIRDWGNGVNPLELPANTKPKDPLKPGGLGLLCIQQMLDTFALRPEADGMLLEMIKLRPLKETG